MFGERINIMTMVHGVRHERLLRMRGDAKRGAKIDLDLGCGDGKFTARYAERTQRWVLGLDGYLSPDSKADAENIVILCLSYQQFLDQLNGPLDWLRRAVGRVFVNMPNPPRCASRLQDEIDIWRRTSARGGELHVRTEYLEVTEILCERLSRYRQIRFAPEARDILTTDILRYGDGGRSVRSFAWQMPQ